MNYGVRYDILVNEKAAVASINAFSNAVSAATPKIIADLKRINNQITLTQSKLSNLASTARSLNSISLSRARSEVAQMQAQLRALKSKSVTVTTRYVNGDSVVSPTTTAAGAGGGGGARGSRQFVSPVGGLSSKKLLPTSFLAGLSVPLITMGATALFGRFIRDMISESSQFQDTMTSVKNILRTTDKEASTFAQRFELVSDHIQQIGVDTKFTSLEIAGAAKYLAMAGQDLSTIDASMRPIANLAALSDTPIDKVADVVTNIMAGYGIAADSIEAASDVIASAATSTNTSVLEMAESFKFASRPLQMAGISFNEAAAAIGILANAGVKGTLAGTAIRAMMIRLTAPTKKAQQAIDRLGVSITQMVDGKVKMRSLSDIFKDFRKAGATVADLYQVFDKIAGGASTAVYQSLLQLDYLTNKTSNAGGIAEFLAEEKMKTVIGLWDQITSQIKYLNQSVFNFIEPVIKQYQTQFLEWLKSPDAKIAFMEIGNFIKEAIELATTLFKFLYDNFALIKSWFIGKFIFNRLVGLTNVVYGLINAVTTFTAASTTATAAAGASGLAGGVGAIGGAASVAVTGVLGVVAAFGVLAYDVWTTRKATNEYVDELSKKESKFLTLEAIENNFKRIRSEIKGAKSDYDILIGQKFEKHGTYYGLGGVATGFAKTMNFMSGMVGGKTSTQNRMFAIEQILPKEIAPKLAENVAGETMKVVMSSIGSPDEFSKNIAQAKGIHKALYDKGSKIAPLMKDLSDEEMTYEYLSGTREAIIGAAKLTESWAGAAESLGKMWQTGDQSSIFQFLKSAGITNVSSISDLKIPGSDQWAKGDIREIYQKLIDLGIPQSEVEAKFKTLGWGEVLSSMPVPTTEFDPNVTSPTGMSGNGMEGLSLSGSNGSGIKGSGSKNIIVNINNLMNVESATLEGDMNQLKDKMAQALMDVVKDFEIAYN